MGHRQHKKRVTAKQSILAEPAIESVDLVTDRDSECKLVEPAVALNATPPPESISVSTSSTSSWTQSTVAPNSEPKRPNAERNLADLTAEEYLAFLDNSTADEINHLINKPLVQKPEAGLVFCPRAARLKFLETPQEPRTVWSIMMWWESQRLVYNLIVGLAGLPTAFLMFYNERFFATVGFISPWMILFGIFQYAIMVNICYCLGAPAEMVTRFSFKEQASRMGPILWVLGTVFSAIITFAFAFLAAFFVAVMNVQN